MNILQNLKSNSKKSIAFDLDLLAIISFDIHYRFAPTRPPVHWSGIRSTTGYGPVCPQAFPDISNASVAITKMPLKRLQYLRKIQPKLIHEAEDCLYLNIYVPKGGKLHFNYLYISYVRSLLDELLKMCNT